MRVADASKRPSPPLPPPHKPIPGMQPGLHGSLAPGLTPLPPAEVVARMAIVDPSHRNATQALIILKRLRDRLVGQPDVVSDLDKSIDLLEHTDLRTRADKGSTKPVARKAAKKTPKRKRS